MREILTICTLVTALMTSCTNKIEEEGIQLSLYNPTEATKVETSQSNNPTSDGDVDSLVAHRIKEPLSIFDSKEEYDDCGGRTGRFDGPGGWGWKDCFSKPKVREMCGGEYHTIEDVGKDEFYLFCTADEYLATHWREELQQHGWLDDYQDHFDSLEKHYDLPQGTLAAVASPRAIDIPREHKVANYNGFRVGYFQLRDDVAEGIGLNIVSDLTSTILNFHGADQEEILRTKDDRMNLHITAEALAQHISKHYSETGDLDFALQQTLGDDAPELDRIRYIATLMNSPSCARNSINTVPHTYQ